MVTQKTSCCAAKAAAVLSVSYPDTLIQHSCTSASDPHRHQRKQLEADVVGLKAWVRTMQVGTRFVCLCVRTLAMCEYSP
jgi:hypothetical protein